MYMAYTSNPHLPRVRAEAVALVQAGRMEHSKGRSQVWIQPLYGAALGKELISYF